MLSVQVVVSESFGTKKSLEGGWFYFVGFGRDQKDWGV